MKSPGLSASAWSGLCNWDGRHGRAHVWIHRAVEASLVLRSAKDADSRSESRESARGIGSHNARIHRLVHPLGVRLKQSKCYSHSPTLQCSLFCVIQVRLLRFDSWNWSCQSVRFNQRTQVYRENSKGFGQKEVSGPRRLAVRPSSGALCDSRGHACRRSVHTPAFAWLLVVIQSRLSARLL